MSETDNEDRTEAPSEKRVRDARERVDVPRSRELANVAVLGCATLALKVTGPHVGAASRDWMRNALQFEGGLIDDPTRLPVYAAKTFGALLMPLAPLAFAMSSSSPTRWMSWVRRSLDCFDRWIWAPTDSTEPAPRAVSIRDAARCFLQRMPADSTLRSPRPAPAR